MRHTRLTFLFGFALCLTLLAGCGGDSGGPAKPAADMDEMQQFLADNPDQDVDGLEEEMNEGDLDDSAE